MIVKWEDELDKELKDPDSDVSRFWTDQPRQLPEPLSPRSAFYGGRTGGATLYYKAKPGEKVSYLDVTSLVCLFFLFYYP